LLGSQASAQLLQPPTGSSQTNSAPAAESPTPAAQQSSNHAAQAKSELDAANAAMRSGAKDQAMQKYASALLFGKDIPQLSESFAATRKQIIESGVSSTQLDAMVRIYQSSNKNRAAGHLSSGNTSAAQPQTMGNPAQNAAPPSMLSATSQLPLPAGQSAPSNPLRDRAAALAAQAKLALDRNDLVTARAYVDQANALTVPAHEFSTGQIKPWQVAMELQRRENQFNPQGGVSLAGGTAQNGVVSTGVYQPGSDSTSMAQASGSLVSAQLDASDDDADTLFRKGIEALTAGSRDRALALFRMAWQNEADLDPATRAQLKDKLTLLQMPAAMPNNVQGSNLGAEDQREMLVKQQLFREVSGEIAAAESEVPTNPMASLERLKQLRQRVSQKQIDGNARKQMLTMVDRYIGHIQAYVDANKADIDQKLRNRNIEEANAAAFVKQAEVESETQRLVEQYNILVNQNRFAEAEVLAKDIRDLNPDNTLGAVMAQKAVIQRREREAFDINSMKGEMFVDALNSVERASIPFNDEIPYQMPTAERWDEISRLRREDDNIQMSATEKEIRRAMERPVSFEFDNTPLYTAVEQLSTMLPFHINLDVAGLASEGLTKDQPISLNLRGNEISLRAALRLMLSPYNLVVDIEPEYVTITSRSRARRESKTQTYSVKDLVIPIPNFVTDYNSGLAGALRAAYMNQGRALLVNNPNQSLPSNFGNNGAAQYASVDPSKQVLGQMGMGFGNPGGGGMMGGGMMGGGLSNGPMMGGNPFGGTMGGANQPALGGASIQDFQQLIFLIQTTVDANWELDGGSDTITPNLATLSLVVNAPQETQEAIRDLLAQLRALQNLQVTIEVRFITLSDNFYERVGIDFDISIDDNTRGIPQEDQGPSVTVGLDASGVPRADLDVRFDNNFLGTAIPPFGNFDADSVGRFGIAILSDIELFFLLEAAQSDVRNNVLQAPKVTMFDGQTASVIDQATRPFVMGLTPVVGDFAVAQQPIIVMLNDGTQLNVQSVVSPDKRFVRMTLSPQFTRIEDAGNTFTFEGTRTSRSGSTVLDPGGNPLNERDDVEDIVTGSTVQLPTLGVTTINTTVTVPDGGTILLGGIKRLSEGRVERGVPILSKVPYINRLFKNVGVGRTTNTLMMTVSPRIIIPEEEEANLTGNLP
jgi:general secretion pathway protein D